MASKVEKQLVVDYLQGLRKKYEEEDIPITDRYVDLKKFKLPSNTTVVCLNCLGIRHKRSNEKCCEEAPKYDLTSSYRIILDHIENGDKNGNTTSK